MLGLKLNHVSKRGHRNIFASAPVLSSGGQLCLYAYLLAIWAYLLASWNGFDYDVIATDKPNSNVISSRVHMI